MNSEYASEYDTPLAARADQRNRVKICVSEAKRLDALLTSFGIVDDIRIIKSLDVQKLLDPSYYNDAISERAVVADYIVDSPMEWASRFDSGDGSIIVIDGGDDTSRHVLSRVVLMGGIFSGVGSDTDAAEDVSMFNIIPVFNSFDDERFSVRNRMLETPFLMISDLSSDCSFRDSGDGCNLFDSVIKGRRSGGKPTAFVLTTPSEAWDVKSMIGKQIETVLKEKHSMVNRICRLRAVDMPKGTKDQNA